MIELKFRDREKELKFFRDHVMCQRREYGIRRALLANDLDLAEKEKNDKDDE